MNKKFLLVSSLCLLLCYCAQSTDINKKSVDCVTGDIEVNL